MSKNSQIDESNVVKFVQKYGTGKFVFSKSDFRENINNFLKSFSTEFSNITLAYSLKANYHSELLTLANELNLGFDCASLMEVNKALDALISPEKIWVNSPYLNQELLNKCIEKGICIHVDSLEQLRTIQKEAEKQRKTTHVGVRFNFPYVDASRFGIEATSANSLEVCEIIQSSEFLNLKTLHTHFSGRNRSHSQFAKRALSLYTLYKKWFSEFDIQQLNIGGGISGPMPNELVQQFDDSPSDYTQYAKALKECIGDINSSRLSLVVEPGMALAANAFSFLAEVLHIKDVNGKSIALLNTSRLFVKPTGHNRSLSFEVTHCSEGNHGIHELVGITCMENDILGEYSGELAVGDYILFKNVGAYTLSYRPDFIFEAPETIVLDRF